MLTADYVAIALASVYLIAAVATMKWPTLED